MDTLVTGGAGFIGSHLCQILLTQGHSVTVVDNFATGSRDNLREFADHPRLTVQEGDVTDRQALAQIFPRVDWVFHLAGLADIVPSIEKPDLYFQTNVQGTLNVLECARATGSKRLIYAASASCYGIPSLYPTPETAAIQTEYPYALTKFLGEQLVLHWAKVYRLPALALRLFNVYGPRSRTTGAYGAVFGVFLAQKLHDQPLTVVGNGTQTRDFIYVTDVAAAFLRAAHSPLSGQSFNVGSGHPQSVNRLVELIGGPTIHLPKRPGEPDQSAADITAIRHQLGWEPRISFEEGVQQVLARIEEWRPAPVWNPETIAQATATWFRYLEGSAP